MAFAVSIITPERALPEIQADHVTFIAVDGEIGIRTGHAALVALMKQDGYILIRPTGAAEARQFAVRGGVAHMLNNALKILTPNAVDLHTIDAAALRKRAEGESDPLQKRWLEHQLEAAAAHPYAPPHV